MKKLIILLALIPNFLFAQEVNKGFKLSIKTGLTLANMYGNDVESETFLNGDSPETFYANHPASNKFKSGINFGSLLEYRFNKRYSLGIGVNYIQKGAEINASERWNSTLQVSENVDGKIKWIQNYWTIDLPLKVYFPLKQDEFFLQGGLSFGHLINSKEKGDIDISGEKYQYTNERGANKNETGFLLGLGYNYLLPNMKNSLIFEFIWMSRPEIS
jgi:long-subunit fatty acid transport protein